MRLSTGRRARLAALVALPALVLSSIGLAACGDDKPQQAPPSAPADQQTCFTEMTPEQKDQLNEYVKQNGDSAKTADTNPDGTQDVCVLQSDGNGGFTEHRYKKDDQFGDYLLYSMLLGRSNSLATFGLLTGDLDVGEAMALSLLTGVGPGGSLYSPYSYTDRGWARQDTVINNTRVTNVYYGNSKPVSYDESTKSTPPGYSNSKVPAGTDQVGKVDKSNNGKVSVAPVKDASAKKEISSAKPADPPQQYKNNSKTAPKMNNPPPAKNDPPKQDPPKEQPKNNPPKQDPPKNNPPPAKPAPPAPKPPAPAPARPAPPPARGGK